MYVINHNIDVDVNLLINNGNKSILPYLRLFVINGFFTALVFISVKTGLWISNCLKYKPEL